MTQEEYSEMLSQAKDQFKSGTALFGKDAEFKLIMQLSKFLYTTNIYMVIFSDMASQSKLIEELSSVIKYVRVSLLSSYNFNANVVI